MYVFYGGIENEMKKKTRMSSVSFRGYEVYRYFLWAQQPGHAGKKNTIYKQYIYIFNETNCFHQT